MMSATDFNLLTRASEPRLVRLRSRQAVADVVASGVSTLILGNDEEISMWKMILSPPREATRVSFREPQAVVNSEHEIIVSSVLIFSNTAKKIFFVSLKFSDSIGNPFGLKKPVFDCTFTFPALIDPKIEMSYLKFCHRIYGSRRESDFLCECFCGNDVSERVVETVCKHTMCHECYTKMERRPCPFCREMVLPKCLINPAVLTVHEHVAELMKTRDPKEWLVLCRGSRRIDRNPLLTAALGKARGGEDRRTPSKHFRAPYFYDLSFLKGCVYEEGWCPVSVLERVIKMMASRSQRTVEIFRLYI